jgi:SAM-dependent MidA family methyltransferase
MLERVIIDRIAREGPISFHDFMEMALYYPELGYYSSPGNKIGKDGDFLTSASYTPVFGKLLGVQLEEMSAHIKTDQFTIVEYGAGTGLLCQDILRQLDSYANLRDRIRYCIIEKSGTLRNKQKALLGDKIDWVNAIGDIGPFEGCVLSNEVVDNFSVHQVVVQDELMEIYVGYENGFTEILRPASPELINYLDELNIKLPRGFRTEINLEAIQWTTDIASVLKKGFVVTIDYGYVSPELYSARRCEGTLTCYHQHTVNHCPYIHIGRQDITSHVNFSALNHWGLKNGLELSGFTSQGLLLMGLGLSRQFGMDPKESISFSLRDFILGMGKKFKVLIQRKGLQGIMLKGMQFTERLS